MFNILYEMIFLNLTFFFLNEPFFLNWDITHLQINKGRAGASQ